MLFTATYPLHYIGFGRWKIVKWPGGIVYYTTDPTFSPQFKQTLAKTIWQLEQRTCIRFKQRISEEDYIIFTSKLGPGCLSTMQGRLGGRQHINIGTECSKMGEFAHEILHALGMMHEHQRPDRDNYIKILYENVNETY